MDDLFSMTRRADPETAPSGEALDPTTGRRSGTSRE
jgi:hypothetical protein